MTIEELSNDELDILYTETAQRIDSYPADSEQADKEVFETHFEIINERAKRILQGKQ